MKNLDHLTFNDIVYVVQENGIEVDEKRVTMVDSSGIYINTFTRIDRHKADGPSVWHQKEYYFANCADAIKFAESNTINRLTALVRHANSAVDAVVKFRKENYDKLNPADYESLVNALIKRRAESL